MSVERFYVHRSPEFYRRAQKRTEAPTAGETPVRIRGYGEVAESNNNSDNHFAVKYRYQKLNNLFLNRIPDPILDLVELAVAIYGVDRHLERRVTAGAGVADENARFDTRSIVIRCPVLSSTFATSEIEELVSLLVSHQTRDIIQFEFLSTTSSVERSVQQQLVPGESNNALSLFSEGLDSAGGVYQNRGEGISARYLHLIYGQRAKSVFRGATTRLDVDPFQVGVRYQGRAREHTQFSRGFLHWCIAACVAAGIGANEIRSFETGIMARFALLSEGWQTTRTASPRAAELFNCLVSTVLDHDVKVVNPFVDTTKGEILEQIKDKSVVRNAVSCPHHNKQRSFNLNNCGQCAPCIIRNIAILSSNHEIPLNELSVCNWAAIDFESKELPQKRAETLPGRNDKSAFFLAMGEIAHLCRLFRNDRTNVIMTEYPKLQPQKDVYDLYRRFADEFYEAVTTIRENNPSARVLLD